MADTTPTSAETILEKSEPEPRWHALVAVVVATSLYYALPPGLTIGPPWIFPTLLGALLVPTVAFHRTGNHRLDRLFGFLVNAVMTVQLTISVIRLLSALPSGRESPNALLVSAGTLWTANVLVFALWYWRLDSGGPHGREMRPGHTDGAFLFPQMTLLPEMKSWAAARAWSPNFLDYLFLAFNTSTAFSPTDTPALARWAKLLMMLQSMISLTVLALLAARAVNML
jgi:hypothetical protein